MFKIWFVKYISIWCELWGEGEDALKVNKQSLSMTYMGLFFYLGFGF